MVEIVMYKGDLRPSLKATLKHTDGTIVNLTSCTCKMQLVETETGLVVFSKTATVLAPPTNGQVQYDWASGDTTQPKKKYKIRIEVTFADITTQTFPKDDDFYLILNEKEGV